jgi:hypothetical protein
MIYAYEISGGYTLKGTIEMGTTWLRDLPDTDSSFLIINFFSFDLRAYVCLRRHL